MKFFDEGKFFFQPNHFFSKNENLRKKYSNVTFNFSVYHPPLGQPWDFTWFFIPMVGTSLKFWSLGWGTSFIYTTQPSGLHWRIFPRPPGAPGGDGRPQNWIPHYRSVLPRRHFGAPKIWRENRGGTIQRPIFLYFLTRNPFFVLRKRVRVRKCSKINIKLFVFSNSIKKFSTYFLFVSLRVF